VSRSRRRSSPGVTARAQYIAPALNLDAFHCPQCGVYSHQFWRDIQDVGDRRISKVRVAWCGRCGQYSIWHDKEMIFPVGATTAPLTHPDLFRDARRDYEEARSIANRSPRGASALLRLVIQKVCKDLGEGGKDLNRDIGNLVKKGLPPTIQRALDVVRPDSSSWST
jgi:predicted RNA-binding Zn-ribbon protein involved in translation (DUF1610 family)